MRKAGNYKIKLGVFVTVVFALFAGGIYLIGERQQLFTRTFRLSGIFKDIQGLQVGNNVRFSGINVGIVEDIRQITDSTVIVDMRIVERSRKFIKKNAKATIGADGLIGHKVLLITPGTSGNAPVENDDIIETIRAVSMDDILKKMKETSDNAAIITTDLAIMTESILEGNGILGKLFVDSVFSQTAEDALLNIKHGAGAFKQNMDAASHNFLLKGYLRKKEKEKEEQKVVKIKVKDKNK